MTRIEYFTTPQKCLIFNFRDVESGPEGTRSLTAPSVARNYFELKKTCFSSSLGKVFQLAEFQANLFLMRN